MEIASPLAEGTILAGKYRVERQLALGDYSLVYLARDLNPPVQSRLLVVKQWFSYSSDPAQHHMLVVSFEREADILESCSHPSIPRFVHSFSEADRRYNVMEFVGGIDLRSRLDETEGFPLEEEVTHWAIGICDTLHYLHTRRRVPIIHGDVRPQHVVLDPSGNTHLIGFGGARGYLPGYKEIALARGAHTAPEQHEGTATPNTDVYGVGATLYHLLTRQPPTPSTPPAKSELAVKVLNPGVSMSMQAIVRKAMQINPEHRFETAEEMKAALIGLGY